MYRFVEAEREGERSVNRACTVLEVSRAAYYEWSKHEPSAREREDQELTGKVRVRVERGGEIMNQTLEAQGRSSPATSAGVSGRQAMG